MARWTRSVIRHRRPIIAAWLVLLVLGGAATANLGDLLTNRFSVPGSDSERGLDLLRQRMHQRSDGAFTLVAR
jgi:putative drug exporter of the RND superfamily